MHFISPSQLLYVWVDHHKETWKKVNPAIEKANHLVIFSSACFIDPINLFILKENDKQFKSLDTRIKTPIKPYQDSNIEVVGKVWQKYYTYRDLEIHHVYD